MKVHIYLQLSDSGVSMKNKLVSSGSIHQNYFGFSVAINENYAIVASPLISIIY